MRKYFYFTSNKKKKRKRATVQVISREWGTVCVAVEMPGGNYIVGSELTPAEAREMAAGLLELADVAEREGIEHANDA